MEEIENLDDILNEGLHQEPKGSPIDEKSEQIVNNWFAKDVDQEYVKKLKKCYAEPKNTEFLSIKDVNKEVYRSMTENLKQKDYWMKFLHTIAATTVAVFELLTFLCKIDLNSSL